MRWYCYGDDYHYGFKLSINLIYKYYKLFQQTIQQIQIYQDIFISIILNDSPNEGYILKYL